jgi:ketosteroid isomerase-like protein
MYSLPGIAQQGKPLNQAPSSQIKPKEEQRLFPDKSHETKKIILSVLSKQEKEWNAGNIDSFMEGYWNSDTLRMVSNRGVTYGFEKIKANYKKNYPDSVAMGKLDFDIIHVELINENNAMVTGKWLLKIDKKFKGGYFTLLFRKLKNKWLIVADHTS